MPHLILNRRIGPIGHVRRDFDAAIDRSRREQQHIALRQLQPIGVHAEEMGVLADRRKESGPLSFELHAQKVEHVAARQNLFELVCDFDAELGDAVGDQRRRAADDHLRAQLCQSMNVAASHAAMGDVADEADG